MGTNYYLVKKGNGKAFWESRVFTKELHIGKNSYGWNFLLHGYTRLGIDTPEVWERLLTNDKYMIKDEYNREVEPKYLLDLIYHKKGDIKDKSQLDKRTLDNAEVVNNLLRRKEKEGVKHTVYTCDMLFDIDFE